MMIARQEQENLKIATWNVRGLTESKRNPEPKTYNVLKILKRYGIDIAILTETKMGGDSFEEEYDIDGIKFNIYYSGAREEHRNHHGVALVVRKDLWRSLSGEWESISNRLVSARFAKGNEEAWIVGAYAPTNVSDEAVKGEFYDQLHNTLRKVPDTAMLVLLGDFNANINPHEECSSSQVVGPYGCSRRPTSDNGLRLLELCSCFSLVLTNTLHKVKTRDIMTYKDKCSSGEWRLVDYVAVRRRHLSRFYKTRALRGARQLYPQADHHLVRSTINLWEPQHLETHHQRKQKASNGTCRSWLDVSKLKQPQLASTLAALDLSGLNWSDASRRLYCQAKKTVGLQKHKAAYWVYDHKAEVEVIVAERKAAGNSRDACRVAKRKFALLKDKWWNKRADRLERAAETGDLKLQYQLSKEVCGPTARRPISLPFPGTDRATKNAKETVDAFRQHFERVFKSRPKCGPHICQ